MNSHNPSYTNTMTREQYLNQREFIPFRKLRYVFILGFAFVIALMFYAQDVDAVGTYPAVDPNMILYYHFNNDSNVGENATKVYDYSLNNNNGTLINITQYLTGSEINDGYLSGFNATNSVYVLINDSNSLDSSFIASNVSNFTLSFWANITGYNASSNNYILSKASASNFEYAVSIQSNGRIAIQYWSSAGNSHCFVSSTTSATLNTWTNIVFTLNSSSCLVYYNGIFEASGVRNFANNLTNTNSNFVIGKRGDNLGIGYNGSIDEVIIWNTTLTKSQISQNYINYIGCFTPTDKWSVLLAGNISLCQGNYNLNGSSTGAITISTDNVNFDCNNSLIYGNNSGSGLGARGFYINQVQNTTISNCIIDGYHIGIQNLLNGYSNTIIKNNKFLFNFTYGNIYINTGGSTNPNKILIYNNTLNISISGSAEGVSFFSSTNLNITDVNITNNVCYQNSPATNGCLSANYLKYSVISNNLLLGSKMSGSYGIYMSTSTDLNYNVSIVQNNITNNQYSIFLGGPGNENILIKNNYIYTSDQGIVLSGNRKSVIITNNTFWNITTHYDGYDSVIKFFNSTNVLVLNNNLSYFGSTGIQSQISENNQIINNTFECIPFNQRNQFSAVDTRQPPSAIQLTPLFKSYVGFSLESVYKANIRNLTQLTSHNFNITGNTFGSNCQLFLWTQGSQNITHDISNYWFERIQNPTFLIPPSDYYISNNFNNLSSYDGSVTQVLGSGYSNTFFINYTVTRDYLFFKNINASNNMTNGVFNRTNALIFNPLTGAVFGSTNINDNDGNINITLSPGNSSYVLDNFNLTEGTTRTNSPLSITSLSVEAYKDVYTLDSTLSSSISGVTFIPSNQECPLDVEVNGVSQTFSCDGEDLSSITITTYGADQFELELLYATATDDTCTNINGIGSKLFKGLGFFFIFAILGGAAIYLYVAYGGGEFDWFSLVIYGVIALLMAFFFTAVLSMNLFEGATC